MILQQVVDAIQSSALAPLFIEPDRVQIERREDLGKESQEATLKLVSAFPDAEETLSLVLMENEHSLILRIPMITQSKDPNVLCRCGHVNLMVETGRLYWDPKDGEIGLNWALRKDGPDSPSLALIEYVIANLLLVSANESVVFFAMSIRDQPKQVRGPLEAIAKAADQRVKEMFAPVIEPLVKGA